MFWTSTLLSKGYIGDYIHLSKILIGIYELLIALILYLHGKALSVKNFELTFSKSFNITRKRKSIDLLLSLKGCAISRFKTFLEN